MKHWVWIGIVTIATGCAGTTHAPAPAEADEAAGMAAYEAKDWARCAALLERSAERSSGRAAEGIRYNAACCHARAGHADRAFALLDTVADMRDVDHLKQDPDLEGLHGDARWAALVATFEKRLAAWEATLGDPALRRELLALVEEDQAARNAWIARPQDPAAAEAVKNSDRKTTARMKAVIAERGWPGNKLVGEDGARAAWLLVQHADADPEFQKQCLALIEALLASHDVGPREYAYLYDRVAIAEKRPQRWGTQFNGSEPFPIEDAANVDARRKEIGLQTMAEYKRLIEAMYGKKP